MKREGLLLCADFVWELLENGGVDANIVADFWEVLVDGFDAGFAAKAAA